MKSGLLTHTPRSVRLGVGALLLGAVTLLAPMGALANSVTITSLVTRGPADPVSSSFPNPTTVTRGGFTIDDLNPGPQFKVDDGQNETTSWNFSYSSGDMTAFNTQLLAPGAHLTSAVMTLNLTIGNFNFTNDHTSLGFPYPSTNNLGQIGDTSISSHATINSTVFLDAYNQAHGSGTVTVSLQLLNFYSESGILSAYNGSFSGTPGIIPANFSDDARVNSASLALTASTVPEPASLLLLGSGLVGLTCWRLRKK